MNNLFLQNTLQTETGGTVLAGGELGGGLVCRTSKHLTLGNELLLAAVRTGFGKGERRGTIAEEHNLVILEVGKFGTEGIVPVLEIEIKVVLLHGLLEHIFEHLPVNVLVQLNFGKNVPYGLLDQRDAQVREPLYLILRNQPLFKFEGEGLFLQSIDGLFLCP